MSTVIGQPLPQIKKMLIQGDSLSDTGILNNRKTLGLRLMHYLSGLSKSPYGEFTNGRVWSQDFMMFLHQQSEHRALRETLSKLGSHEQQVAHLNERRKAFKETMQRERSSSLASTDSLNFDDPSKVIDHATVLMRSYAEGGLSAHNYAWQWILNIKLFFTRLLVSSLEKKRETLIQDDELCHVSADTKAQTLVVEWSGANDLITTNVRPSLKAVNLAIEARIQNVKAMYAQGYRNFTLFNLPDLSLTPRYQTSKKDQLAIAYLSARAFNKQLQKAVQSLKDEGCYPELTLHIFDVNHYFTLIHDDPEKYGFDKAKLTQPWLDDKPSLTPGAVEPSKGHMFWDGVHPSAELHDRLAMAFEEHFAEHYVNATQPNLFPSPKLEEPASIVSGNSCADLVEQFKDLYAKRLDKDYHRFFGGWSKSRFFNIRNATLEDIFHHALNNGGKRTLSVLKELNWLDSNNELSRQNGAISSILESAYCHVTGGSPTHVTALDSRLPLSLK